METIAVKVRAPFPWARLLHYLSHRMIPGAERIEGSSYIRRDGDREAMVDFDEANSSLRIRCDSSIAERAVRRASVLFDVEHDGAGIDAYLSKHESLVQFVRACPGLRPLGTWSPFELCCRTILGQQVTVAAAKTLMGRLIQRCGSLSPEAILAADLQRLGMPGARVRTLLAFASAVKEGSVDLDGSWSDINGALAELPGFGPWTRTYLAIRLGREADAFPASDIGLLRATGASTPAELLQLAESWRPFRAYAAAYLWMHG